MADYRGFDFLDIVTFLFMRKKFLSVLFLASFFTSYVLIYFLVEEQYEASVLIIPVEDEGAAGISSMLKSIKGLPINLGGSASTKSEINRYNTIIYSRTSIEAMIERYGLYQVYDIDTTDKDYREQAIKELRKDILTDETKDNAFIIIVRSDNPLRAASMANSVVQLLNEKIIHLKVSKSRENRLFLEKRVREVSDILHSSEDSLKKFQEKSGLLDIKSQIPEMMTVYANLEADLIAKSLKKNILERLYDKQSSEVKNLEIEIGEYQKKLNGMHNESSKGSVLIAKGLLPNTVLEYIRRYRDVEINTSMLEFILPLYEQAKIEEKKDYPILQVIDQAVPPSKKSWPPRALFSLGGALFVTASFLLGKFVTGVVTSSVNPKVILLRQEFRKLVDR